MFGDRGRGVSTDSVLASSAMRTPTTLPCRWIDQTHNLVILGKSSVGKSYLAQALVNAACRRDYTARYFRLEASISPAATRRYPGMSMSFLKTPLTV